MVVQQHDQEVDQHFQSQVGRLLDFYLELGVDHPSTLSREECQSPTSAGVNPSVENFQEWLKKLFVLRLETHDDDWTGMMENALCSSQEDGSTFARSCLDSEEWTFNHGHSHNSKKKPRRGVGESGELFAALGKESRWLSQQAAESIYRQYECDFIAFGYSKWMFSAQEQEEHEHASAAISTAASEARFSSRHPSDSSDPESELTSRYLYNAMASSSEGRVRREGGGRGGVLAVEATVECMRQTGMFERNSLA